MRLILLRHGIAEDRRVGLDDADRRLTPAGIERTRLATRGLAALYGPVDAVLTSPKRRALETAELLGEALGQPPEVTDVLACGGIDETVALLRERDDSVLVLVGHEPIFSMTAERLLTGHTPHFIDLKKAGAVVLRLEWYDTDEPAAVLEALLTPRALRAAAGQPDS